MAELISISDLEVAWSIMTKRPQAVTSLLEIYLKPTSGYVKLQFLPNNFPLINSTTDDLMHALIELYVESRVTTKVVKPKSIDNNKLIFPSHNTKPEFDKSVPENLDYLLKTWEENNFDCATVFPYKGWQGNKIFIIGDPGYGKTNTAFNWFLRCMKKYRENAYQGFLPIIVAAKTLAHFIDDNTGLNEAIKFEICRLIDLNDRKDKALINNLCAILDEAVLNNRLFLVLDGLDEVAKDKQEKLDNAIVSWSGPILLISRMNNFEFFSCFPATPCWLLLEMESTNTFLKKWGEYQNIDNIQKFLKDNLKLGNFLRVPLLAVIACRLFAKTNLDVPNSTFLLMALVKDLLKSYNDDDDDADTNDLVTLLAHVAAKTFTGDRWSITRGQFIKIGKDKAIELSVDINKFFKFIIKSGSLLTKTDVYKNEFEILHQSLIEVLVAEGLLNEIRNKKDLLSQNQDSIYLNRLMKINMQKGGTYVAIYFYLKDLIDKKN